MLFQDFPGPGIFKKKIQYFPGGAGTLNCISVFGILGSKHIVVTRLIFQCHVMSSVKYHLISPRPFPIGGPLERSLHLQPF